MNEKDKTSKTLEQHTDVFSDIVNVLLFDGCEIVKPSDLKEKVPRSQYKSNSLLFEQERDVIKYWVANGVTYALLGLENQAEPDEVMPLRTFGYDGADYRWQLYLRDDLRRQFERKQKKLEQSPRRPSTIKKFSPPPLFPAITIVLYFGLEKWTAPVALSECLHVPDYLKPYFNDYQINLFQIAFLDDEIISKFKSDFRYVAELLKQTRLIKEKKLDQIDLTPVNLVHALHTLDLLYSMTGDRRFMDAAKEIKRGGDVEMYTAFDAYEEIGEARGVKIGTSNLQSLLRVIRDSGNEDDLSKAISATPDELKELYEKYGIDQSGNQG